ncbi:MAG: lipoate--protein ligase family protein [Bythopirellula sp.]|nr:lipoate--protein ligase family protein [Bythopirellula sp.]
MWKLDLTLPLPAENLALDEALLDACAAGEITGGVLRLWEPDNYFVVLGRSSDPSVEVNLTACRALNIPVLRRASGGGTILAGPGCLMYAVVLSYADQPELKSIPRAHQFVLNRIATSLASLVPGITLAGISDLAFSSSNNQLQKFSGNALRAKRTHFLYHGTLLHDFDLDRVGQLLAQATREPNYRNARTHGEFIANLPASREQLVNLLTSAWNANANLVFWPQDRMAQIVKQKYVRDSTWIIK